MEVVIKTGGAPVLNWTAKGTDRIIQNVANLLATKKYEVAYDRTLGMSPDIEDKPLPEAVAQATSEIIELIGDYEPRATVKDVKYAGVDANGNMVLEVTIEI